MKKRNLRQRYIAFIIMIVMLLTMLPLKVMAEEEADNGIPTRAAMPESNWTELEPGNPDYWPVPYGTRMENTTVTFVGLRYDGSTENTIKLIMPTTISVTDNNILNFQFKIDSDLLPYVKEVRAGYFRWFAEAIQEGWRTCTAVGVSENGVYQVPFWTMSGGLIPNFNMGTLNQIMVPVEIILKDKYTTANIPQEPYIVQLRVNAEKNGSPIIAEESYGKGTTVFPNPTTGGGVSNWLNEPAIMSAEYDEETNILTYYWRNNPPLTYNSSGIDGIAWKNKPFVLNVIADPLIIDASTGLEIYAEAALGAQGPHYIMNEAKLNTVFSDTSNPGYRSAKITPDNGSVDYVDNYIRRNQGSADIPIYTYLKFKINPEELFVDSDTYHIKAPIKMFFTEKLGSSQNLIKNSSAENFFMISKTFYLPEVDDVYTEDTAITGFTHSPNMFVKITLPNGTTASGRSADVVDTDGKYPFSINLPEGADLKKGDEIKVQNAEKGKVLSNPVVETVNAKIKFDKNYSGAPEAQVVIANDDKNINTLGDKMPEVPTRDGYIFAGWYDNAQGTGEEFTGESTIVKSKTVYAKWDQKLAYTVKYFVGGKEQADLEKTGFVPSSKPYVALEDIKIEIPEKNFLKVEPVADSLGRVNIPTDGIIKMYYDGNIIDVTDPNTPTPNGYSRVTFDAKENGKFADEVVHIFDVKNGVEFPEEKAPKVSPNTGFTFKAWEPKLPLVISGTTKIDATYDALPDIIGPFDPTNPPEKPAGYVRVSYKAGANGSIANPSDYFVNPKKNIKFGTLNHPGTTPNVGYEFMRWTVDDEFEIIVDISAIAQFTALADIIVDSTPDTDDDKPNGYVTVWFKTDARGTLDGNVKYYVNPLKSKTMADISAPRIVPVNGIEVAQEKWDPVIEDSKVINTDLTYNAKYKDIIIDTTPDTDNDKPDGYVTVLFKSDEKGELIGFRKFYVNPTAGKTMAEITPPTIRAFVGYVVADEKWNPVIDTAKVIDADLTYNAQYTGLADIIDGTDPTVVKPDGYKTVEFLPGTNGTLEGSTKFYVNPLKAKTMEAIAEPTIKANVGFKVADEKWNPALDKATVIDKDLSYTAQYIQLDDIIDVTDPDTPTPNGYFRVTFNSGENGTFADGTVTMFDVKGGVTFPADKAPEVTPNEGYKFGDEKWNPSLPLLINKAETITANIVEKEASTKPVIKPVTDADNKIVVEAPAGGTVTVTVPGVTDPIVAVDNGDGTYTATIPDGTVLQPGDVINASNTEPDKNPTPADPATITETTIPVTDPNAPTPEGFVRVTLKPGENGSLTEATGTTKQADGTILLDVKKDTAILEKYVPTIVANEGFNVAEEKWSPAIATPVTDTAKDFEAQYIAQVQTEAPTIKPVTDKDTTVGGTAPAGSTVTVTFPGKDGNPMEVNTTADDNGNYQVDVPENADMTSGKEITAVAKEEGKKPSDPATATITETTIPLTDPNAPTPEGFVRVTLKPGENGSLTEATGTTKQADGTILLDVKKDTAILEKYVPTIVANEGFNVAEEKWSPAITTPVTDTAKDFEAQYIAQVQTEAPTIKPVTDKDTTVGGTAPAGSTVTVTFPGKDGNPMEVNTTADDNGNYQVDVPENADMTSGKEITAVAKEEGKKPSDPVTATITETTIPVTDPNAPTPEGFVRVTLKPGENGSLTEATGTTKQADGTILLDVKNDTAILEKYVPTIVANEGFNVAEEKWSPAITTPVTDTAKDFEAQYIEKDPSTKPVIKPVKDTDKTIVVEAPTGGKVEVTVPGVTDPIVAVDNGDGTYTATIPEGTVLNPGDEINASNTEPGKNPTPADPIVVTDAGFDPENVAGMKITTPPTKVEYKVGEKFDPTGMVVTLTDGNGKTKEVPYAEFAENNLTVPTSKDLELTDTVVTVTYEKGTTKLTDDQPITVTEKDPSTKPVIKPVKDTDKRIVVEAPAGGEVTVTVPGVTAPIVAVDNGDGTYTATIPEGTVLNPGDEINASNTEPGKNPTPADPIVVTDAGFDPEKVVSMNITKAPDKVIYTEGDFFNPTGMEVTLTDVNGKTKVVPYEEFAQNSLTVPTDKPLETTDTAVRVTYTGVTPNLTADQPITVNLMELSAKPVDLKQEFTNDRQIITGNFDNGYRPDPATSEVILVDVDGNPILGSNGQPIKGVINLDGTFEFPIDDLNHGQVVKVQLTEAGKKPTISDESITIDKQGPSIEEVYMGTYGDFLDIQAQTDDPQANFVIKVGEQEFPATVYYDGRIIARIPKDAEGEIKIVGTDLLGNKNEEVVVRPTEPEFLEVNGRQPYAGEKAFIAFARDGYEVHFQLIRDEQPIQSIYQTVSAGRATFKFPKYQLQSGDKIRIQANYEGKISEEVIFVVE